ncbi:tyrosine-type recombinase/integrase [Phyllobacterium chamaecytisi]|uniref:tyrosine-type recombinase/integrase n=1 Tax=Phyllobacterium chamaecytisi TaxID=2876082 RepID=UPI001CC8FAC0|nr:tyrosine-type recombinase/integrase [Phyllobacterium sp. KW56]MBZ9606179.1 tyrosine-type recombinase/integrase [Phyllobacterium sp. KW56]
MRGVYVRKKSVVKERLKAGLAAAYVDDFTEWLRQRRYTEKTIVECIRLLASWTNWARSEDYTLDTIRSAYSASFALIRNGHRPRFRGDVNKDSVEIAKLFISYLENTGVLPCLPAKPELPIVAAFTIWAREQHGLAETTLGTYQGAVIPFVEAVGDDTSAYDAEVIRAYMLERAGTVSVARLKGIGVAVRAFLRFLIATGQCAPGLDHAMPNAAGWRLASVPRFLPEADIARIIAACDGERRLRDRAIILLLVRLGLRASEVARLTFDDIDWRQGTIRLHGKGRREELLPLTQDIGDAIIDYIERGRPKLSEHAIFLTESAPIRPIDRIAVKCLVKRALTRGGVESTYKGAHVLRHSAATAMLRHGVSLTGVGTVLRHRSPAMTAHYAKVDIALLSSIAQPWPGRQPC